METIVSIHAPTRGATRFTPRGGLFNQFQSTHPHGVRPWLSCVSAWVILCFNPRTHTGCDIYFVYCKGKQKMVSIHAPTRGATTDTSGNPVYRMFQSTHPHGVRLLLLHAARVDDDVSIHAPTRGATMSNMIPK